MAVFTGRRALPNPARSIRSKWLSRSPGDVLDTRKAHPGQGAPSSSAQYDPATVYYLPGTTGWDSGFAGTFAGIPAVQWNLWVRTSDATFGVLTNQFGFTVNGSKNLIIVVEASTSLTNPTWLPVSTNALTDGASCFSDAQWTNYPSRFYRVRMR